MLDLFINDYYFYQNCLQIKKATLLKEWLNN